MDIETSLKSAVSIDGAIGAALVDYESGMMLGSAGDTGVVNLELAAAGNTEVIRAKMRTIQSLELGDEIEDILITLGRQYHIIRLLRTARSGVLFLYLVLDRNQANLALARHELRRIENLLDA
jgi:hypothetical protein